MFPLTFLPSVMSLLSRGSLFFVPMKYRASSLKQRLIPSQVQAHGLVPAPAGVAAPQSRNLFPLSVILAHARIQCLFFFFRSQRQNPWIPDQVGNKRRG